MQILALCSVCCVWAVTVVTAEATQLGGSTPLFPSMILVSNVVRALYFARRAILDAPVLVLPTSYCGMLRNKPAAALLRLQK